MKSSTWGKFLLLDVLLLLLVGLVMIASASVVLSYTKFGHNYYYVKHHLFYGILPGLGLMYLMTKIDYRRFKTYAPYFLLLTFVCLLIVFVPHVGVSFKGAYRWVSIFGLTSFQPAELAKVFFIIYLAAWLDSKRDKINDVSESLFPLLFILFLLVIPILKQPDFDVLMIFSIIVFIMYFVSGIKWRYILAMIAGGASLIMVLIKIAPYRMNRLMVFLYPKLDPLGIGYQINQSLLAIGSGGFFGLGLGRSRQKFNYLPEPMGDGIFAVTGEEMGLLGLLVLLILFSLFAYCSFKIIGQTNDYFGKLLAIGLSSFIIIQALMNMGSVVSVIPLTGITLPFISYGGSSLISSLMAVGILLNIAQNGTSLKYKK